MFADIVREATPLMGCEISYAILCDPRFDPVSCHYSWFDRLAEFP
jgi:hypothetical protein